MSKRTWWKAAVALAVGGAATGGWFGLAQAEPIRAPKDENTVWTRSATAAPAPAITAPAATPAPVVLASAAVPAPIALPTPTVAPPIARPATPPPTSSTVIGEFKAVPPATEESSRPPATLPPLQITKPEAVVPALPALPSLPALAPPAPPSKSADTAKPIPPAIPDFNLRPEKGGNSLKPEGSSAVVLPVQVIPPTLPPLVPEVPTPPEPMRVPPFASVSRPKPVDGPMPPTDKYVFPIPSSGPMFPAAPTAIERPLTAKPQPLTAIPTPGVDPMNVNKTAMATVIGGALAMMTSTPAAALPLPYAPAIAVPAIPTSPVAADAASDLATFKADLVETNRKLADANKEIKRLAELLDGRKDAEGRPSPVDIGAVQDLVRLKDKIFTQNEKITGLEKTIDDLKKSTTALKPTAMATGKGIVRVMNDYPVEITIVVNANSYRVAPNTTLDIPVPVGDFTYQLLSATTTLAPVKSPVAEKEVVKLRIR